MKVLGIIAECNPFHEGHAHLLREAQAASGADYTVVVLSGDYVQRGAPAIQDKYVRTRKVLEGGADLVLELPLYYACGAADYFARGAVSLLSGLNMITDLAFGSESADLDLLRDAAAALRHRSGDEFHDALLTQLRQGKSYAAAQAAFLPALPRHPNDLLAAQYLAALEEASGAVSVRIHPVRRIQVPSASDRRSEMLASPERREAPYLSPDDFSGALLMRLLEHQEDLQAFADVSDSLADRIRTQLPAYTDYSGFTALLKTRDLTYTRVARSLLHILLDIRKEDLALLKNRGITPYARVLGIRSSASSLLAQITQQAAFPVITRVSEADQLLADEVLSLFQKELRAAWLYDLTAAGVQGLSPSEKNGAVPEYGRRLIKI
ncbi:MAG: nucleotidyltransferase family protein [Lachnospiraceae bacterium]|nr:nucleotidyltransferase family protein [Lachnospiraceae bacterium]